MKNYGILAHPAGHSLSPVMHNAAFKALGIEAQYGVFDIPENEFGTFVERVKNEPIYGLSVSLPYKETVLHSVDKLDEAAAQIGALNTVSNQGSVLYGYNTDFVGSNRALEEAVGSLRGKKALVIGAGGAARAIVYGLLKEGADVIILNRDVNKALKLATEMAEIFDAKIIGAGLEKKMNFDGDILVQASSIWTLKPDMLKEEIEAFCPDEFVGKFGAVMDIVYKPLITPLLAKAEKLGKNIVTGEKMLLYQAAEQFKIWTGREAPVEVMKEALEKNL